MEPRAKLMTVVERLGRRRAAELADGKMVARSSRHGRNEAAVARREDRGNELLH